MLRSVLIRVGLIVSLGLLALRAAPAHAADAVVHAVLFYSPTCPHCHDVINNTLTPMAEQYGDSLSIAAVDVSTEDGQQLFNVALFHFAVPEERQGVPMLIIGETVLVGSGEIPAQFPGLVDAYLARGGIGWPEIPGFGGVADATDEAADGAVSDGAVSDGAVTDSNGLAGALARDPVGNGLALVVLAGLVVSLVVIAVQRRDQRIGEGPTPRETLIIGLSLAGMAVAAYLAYVETAQVQAFCGPIGDCNVVQQSPYARLFGLIPIGWLGVAGYVAILAASLVDSTLARQLRFGFIVVGVLFSTYLTFLEPFVIGASCAWCLTSALIMIALLWLTAAPPLPRLRGTRAAA